MTNQEKEPTLLRGLLPDPGGSWTGTPRWVYRFFSLVSPVVHRRGLCSNPRIGTFILSDESAKNFRPPCEFGEDSYAPISAAASAHKKASACDGDGAGERTHYVQSGQPPDPGGSLDKPPLMGVSVLFTWSVYRSRQRLFCWSQRPHYTARRENCDRTKV